MNKEVPAPNPFRHWVLIAMLLGLALVGTAYFHHFVLKETPWYHNQDMNALVITNALALNSNIVPLSVVHPQVLTDLTYSKYFWVLRKIGVLPAASITDLSKSNDPITLIPPLVKSGRVLSLVLIILVAGICGFVAYELGRSVWGFLLAFLCVLTGFGVLFQSLMIRTELLSVLMSLAGFYCVLCGGRQKSIHLNSRGLLLGGMFVALGVVSKIHSYPFAFALLFFVLVFYPHFFSSNGGALESPSGGKTTPFALFSIEKKSENEIFKLYRMRQIGPAIIAMFIYTVFFLLMNYFAFRLDEGGSLKSDTWLSYRYYIFPVLFWLALLPIYFLHPEKWNGVRLRLYGLICFVSGWHLALILVFVLNWMTLNRWNAAWYWWKAVYVVFHPDLSLETYKTASILGVGPVHRMISLLNDYWGILLVFLILFFWALSIRKVRVVDKVLLLCFLGFMVFYAWVLALRGVRPHYWVYLDVVVSLCLAFSAALIYRAQDYSIQGQLEKFKGGLVVMIFGVFCSKFLLQAPSLVKVFDNFNSPRQIERYMVHENWYVFQYSNVMEHAYKDERQFLRRVQKWFAEPQNRY